MYPAIIIFTVFLKQLLSNCVAAEQSSAEHKTQDIYAGKLYKVRESAAALTWLNILGNMSLNAVQNGPIKMHPVHNLMTSLNTVNITKYITHVL